MNESARTARNVRRRRDMSIRKVQRWKGRRRLVTLVVLCCAQISHQKSIEPQRQVWRIELLVQSLLRVDRAVQQPLALFRTSFQGSRADEQGAQLLRHCH